MSSKTAIIGAGPAGCMCAYHASQKSNDANEITIFDFAKPLHTLLYTGGGRCNLAYEEYDFRELTKFYPRGEKFLYSVFSKFCTAETLNFFDEIGVETYVQDDLRIFPKSNSAEEVRAKILDNLRHCGFKREKVIKITKENEGDFLLTTEKNSYHFDKVVIAVGGHAGFELARHIGHTIIEPKPALTGLVTKEKFKPIQGVSLKNISAKVLFDNKEVTNIKDDVLFTHNGISGPLAYKISSICARLDYNANNPLKIFLDLTSNANLFTSHLSPLAFQDMLNTNPKKDIKNLLAELAPRSVAEYILGLNNIDLDLKCTNINGKTRDLIVKSLTEFEITVISPTKEGEVVTSGGVCLDEINPKTMQSKLIANLYFCGEVVDIDGFCGGFNLQNCWSTGFVAGSSL